MDCEGIVTAVNLDFLYFKLDNDKTVHMSILLSQRSSQKFPKLGTKVTVKKAHRVLNKFSVCKSSVLNGEFIIDYGRNRFFNFVHDHRLGTSDLFKAEEVIETFDNVYKDLENNLKIHLVLSTLEHMVKAVDNLVCLEDICLNQQINSVKLLMASCCKYVEIQTDKFIEFPYWSFGTHSFRNTSLLFGYFITHQMYGMLMLKDPQHQIPCLIEKATPEKIVQLENAYVTIKNCTVITEVYKDRNVPNLEYLLIKFEDINIIHKDQASSCSTFGKAADSKKSFKHVLCFQLLRKSMVSTGDNKKPECYFEIAAQNNNQLESDNVYLILPTSYVKALIYFAEGQHYQLHYNEALKQTQNRELLRVKDLKTYRIEEEDAFFGKTDTLVSAKPHLLTVEECKRYVTSNKQGLVSFIGVLKNKRFSDPLESRTKKKSDLYGFGTPGPKVHMLVFSFKQDNKDVYLDCYLNNWENTLMPLGLVPEMQVIVRNMSPQSMKYLKACPFTSFEPVAYEPLINFETVNLYGQHHLNWGEPFFLGLANKLPNNVLVWGKVQCVQILKIEVCNACEFCSLANEGAGPCARCKALNRKFKFFLIMHVSDEFAQSKVLAKYPEIMKVLLDLQDNQFNDWLKAFKELPQYTYNFFEETEVTDPVPERQLFKESLTDYIKTFNEIGHVTLDLKCRKLDSDQQRNKGRPFWLCIDARKH